MNSFTIKDLENLSGIKAHTIRIWEQRYNFLKPSRSTTNIRYYTNEELKKVLNIALLNKYGYKISHIDKMPEKEVQEKIVALSLTEAQQERTINEMIQCMIDLDVVVLEKILDQHIHVKGMERTITQLIFPFLEKIGILWMTNNINPAQERLVTNLIRQKMIVGIDGISTSLKVDATLLLFLPEGEYHELGLLFMCYLLKSRGVSVTYLGANVPINDVAYVVNLTQPDYLYIHLTSIGSNFKFDKFLSAIAQKINQKPIIISGILAQTYNKKLPPNVNFKKSFGEVMEFISGL